MIKKGKIRPILLFVDSRYISSLSLSLPLSLFLSVPCCYSLSCFDLVVCNATVELEEGSTFDPNLLPSIHRRELAKRPRLFLPHTRCRIKRSARGGGEIDSMRAKTAFPFFSLLSALSLSIDLPLLHEVSSSTTTIYE
jgi:hypothetical protein